MMQNYWNICIGDTNMLVSKNAKICLTPKAKHKICVTPNAKPQRKPMEYRLRWVFNTKYSPWPCTFLFVCVCQFHLRWVPFFSGIWALVLALQKHVQGMVKNSVIRGDMTLDYSCCYCDNRPPSCWLRGAKPLGPVLGPLTSFPSV